MQLLLTLIQTELSDKNKYPPQLFLILIKEIIDHEAHETLLAVNYS